MLSLGRFIIALACRSLAAVQNLGKSLDFIQSRYSPGKPLHSCLIPSAAVAAAANVFTVHLSIAPVPLIFLLVYPPFLTSKYDLSTAFRMNLPSRARSDLKNLSLLLVSKPTSVTHVCRLTSSYMMDLLDQTAMRAESMDTHLHKEHNNGRLLRLMMKLGKHVLYCTSVGRQLGDWGPCQGVYLSSVNAGMKRAPSAILVFDVCI